MVSLQRIPPGAPTKRSGTKKSVGFAGLPDNAAELPQPSATAMNTTDRFRIGQDVVLDAPRRHGVPEVPASVRCRVDDDTMLEPQYKIILVDCDAQAVRAAMTFKPDQNLGAGLAFSLPTQADPDLAHGQCEWIVPESWLRPKGALCGATDADTGMMSIREILTDCVHGYRVPLFQRRYCWDERQWEQLWGCVVQLTQDEGPFEPEHSLGRLLLYRAPNTTSVLVLDGQQRLTTCSLLMAALRDRAIEVAAAMQNQHEGDTAARNVKMLIGLLCRRSSDGADVGINVAGVGREVLQAILRPTQDDIADFEEAIGIAGHKHDDSDRSNTDADGRAVMSQIRKCQSYFSRRCASLGPTELTAFTTAATTSLKMLKFTVTGHVNLQAIYQKAAERDRCRSVVVDGVAMSAEEAGRGMPMSAVDLIRNFVLEEFDSEEEQKRIYTEHWLPLERACGGSAISCVGPFSAALHDLADIQPQDPSMLFTAFTDWWASTSGNVTSADDAGVASAAEGKLAMFVHAAMPPGQQK